MKPTWHRLKVVENAVAYGLLTVTHQGEVTCHAQFWCLFPGEVPNGELFEPPENKAVSS